MRGSECVESEIQNRIRTDFIRYTTKKRAIVNLVNEINTRAFTLSKVTRHIAQATQQPKEHIYQAPLLAGIYKQ